MRQGELEYTLWLEPPHPEHSSSPRTVQALESFVQGDAARLIINDLINNQPRRHEVALT